MKLLRRKDIEEMCSVIETLRFKDISRMVGFSDEAVYDIGRVIDNKMLHRRALEIMELVDATPFKSLHSRNLWLSKDFMQIVNDLLNKIDLEIGKVDRLENKIIETPINDAHDVGEIGSEVQGNALSKIKAIKLDKRWTKNTISGHIKRLVPEASGLSDDEILEALDFDCTKELMKDLQKLNPLIKVRMG